MTGDVRGVSPIIGVIFMLALTVVLSTIVGAAFLDFIAQSETDKSMVEIDGHLTTEKLTVSHRTGSSVALSNFRILVRNGSSEVSYVPDTENVTGTGDQFDPGEEYSRSHSLSFDDGEQGQLLVVHVDRGQILVRATYHSRIGVPSSSSTPTPTPTATPTSTPSNSPPTADFTTARKGKKVELDASLSSDSDGSIVMYEWDIGADGSVEYNGETVKEKIPAGTDVKLIVTDDDGATDSITKTVN